jgi:ABC-type amino acid transport substrate-binding protein
MFSKRNLWTLLSALMLVLLIAAQCQPAPPAAPPATEEAPAATEEPAAEEPAAEEPAAEEPAAEEPAAEEEAMAEVGAITVGINAEYPPFEAVDDAGNIVGFDADLMAAIAEAAGFDYEWVNTRWDGIFVALASGEFDAVMSAATITAERAETVDFSDPYFNAGQSITVRADNTDIMGPDDLAGKKASAQLGTTGDIWLTEETQAEVVRYDENTQAFLALSTGDVDAAVADSPTAAEIVRANPEMNLKILPDVYTDEFYGIAVSKERPEVLAAINEGLAAVQASGEYDEIYDKWFGAVEAAEAPMEAEGDLLVISAPCANNKMKEIAALDDMTVQFTTKRQAPPSCWSTPSEPAPMPSIAGTGATASSSSASTTTGASRPGPKPWSSAGPPRVRPACWSCKPARRTTSSSSARMTMKRCRTTPACNSCPCRVPTSCTWL